jgi:hypothetical protein
MNGRRAVIGLSLLCALAFTAFAAPSAQAGTTAFTCVKGGGAQEFTEAHCAANGHNDGNKYGHVGFAGTTNWVSTNKKTANTTVDHTTAILKGTLAGAASELSCTKVDGKGTLTNEEVGGKMQVSGTATVSYRECTVTKPTKGCVVAEPVVAEANVLSVEAGATMGLEFKGKKAGGVFAEIKYENKGAEKCALLNGGKPFPVTGSTVATDKGATSEFTAAHSKLVLGGNAASYTGMETVTSEANGTPLTLTTTSP